MAGIESGATPLSQKILPTRRAVKEAVASLKAQDETLKSSISSIKSPQDDQSHVKQVSDSSDLSDLPDEESSIYAHASSTAGYATARGIKGRGSPRGRPRDRRKGTTADSVDLVVEQRQNKRGLEIAFCSSSPLSSLSRSESPQASCSAGQKRPGQSTGHASSKRPKLVTPRQSKTTASAQFAARLQITSPMNRSPSKLANIYVEEDVVWVRLDADGALQDLGEAQLSYWWPAQVTVDDPLQMSVTLFGNDGHGQDRTVVISRPSESTILPFRIQGRMRFTTSDFMINEDIREIFQSEDRKNLRTRWTQATGIASLADQNYGLPEAPSLIFLMNTVGKDKQAVSPSIDFTQSTTPTRVKKSSVAPLDEEIKIGEKDGELVLAADHKGRLAHWPARVVSVSQDKRSGKWLYEICYIDGKRKKLERSRFFTSEQDGFATCQLGTWQIILPESDSEGTDSDSEFRGRREARSPSPSPSNPDLEDIKDTDKFLDLHLARQMRYVYPILCRVIRREYQPAYLRHDSFIKGGKARQDLGQSASTRGHFSENEMKKVQLLVRRTMLRDERWAERMSDDDVVSGEEYMASRYESDELKEETADDPTANNTPCMDVAIALTNMRSSDPPVHEPSPSIPFSSFVTTDTNSPGTDTFAAGMKLSQAQSAIKELLPTQSITLGNSDMEIDVVNEVPSIPCRSPAKGVRDRSTEETEFKPLEPNIIVSSNSHPTRKRPVGCEDYENLPRSERGLYCADVLLPEAVIQLHLFRDGQRVSTRLLTSDEETKLYERGLELVSENKVHWVVEIMQMRKLAESSYMRRMKKRAGDPIPHSTVEKGGTSTRPRTRRISE